MSERMIHTDCGKIMDTPTYCQHCRVHPDMQSLAFASDQKYEHPSIPVVTPCVWDPELSRILLDARAELERGTFDGEKCYRQLQRLVSYLDKDLAKQRREAHIVNATAGFPDDVQESMRTAIDALQAESGLDIEQCIGHVMNIMSIGARNSRAKK